MIASLVQHLAMINDTYYRNIGTIYTPIELMNNVVKRNDDKKYAESRNGCHDDNKITIMPPDAGNGARYAVLCKAPVTPARRTAGARR